MPYRVFRLFCLHTSFLFLCLGCVTIEAFLVDVGGGIVRGRGGGGVMHASHSS